MSTIPTSDVELWQACAEKHRLVMWTLYFDPVDFPERWVARFFVCDTGDGKAHGTAFHHVAATRSGVEELIPYLDKGRWAFVPEFDPANPQIVGVYM